MTQSIDRLDRLVEDYLGAVSWACADLPPERREDLLTDLREHIAAARAVLYQPTEAAVRTILDRLGEPAAIAEEARLAEGLGPRPAPSPPAKASTSGWLAGPLSPRTVAFLIAFALLLAGILGFFTVVAVLAG
ncbi:MAG TPA: hypothetical protein VGX25_27495 [Actinophytocola sp.]|uniref:HAAS signaling domain-containing protein n=1 Tax=Actinophytocola sp. TaxID=1872138 RepID=UPI002DDD992B|nr:hypothetical protein [Actinophytocola sp.]HEV2783144.1 hypothetical protein [Actinophytocola sp.]